MARSLDKSTGVEETDELRRFREEWQAEVQQRKAEEAEKRGKGKNRDSSRPPATTDPATASFYPQTQPGPSNQTISGARSSSAKQTRPSGLTTNAPLPRIAQNALDLYRQAVANEQMGSLDEALRLYRQAFRMWPDVDDLYIREERLAAIMSGQTAPAPSAISEREEIRPADVEELSKLMPNLSLTTAAHPNKITITGTLAELVASFPDDLSFAPEDEQEKLPLKNIPDELLVHVLLTLDPTSVERFAAVSRKARVLSLDPSIWRRFVQVIYKPPQVPDPAAMLSVTQSYQGDLRRVYVEHPRVRLDGVYIAVCHYVRNGLGENSWVNISHLITYHRYLRFFPNGLVLSLLTNEEHPPTQVIPLLKPSLRMKGLLLGTWQLINNTVVLNGLFDASGKYLLPPHLLPPLSSDDSSIPAPVVYENGQDPYAASSTSKGATTTSTAPTPAKSTSTHARHGHGANLEQAMARYYFSMTLELQSRPLGRWNKLTIHSYDSVNLETNDTSPVVLKHERPFWFSKVKSYAVF